MNKEILDNNFIEKKNILDENNYNKNKYGLKGWLFLLGISILILLLQQIKSITKYFEIIYNTIPKDDYSKIFIKYVRFECMLKAILTIFLIYLLLLFFSKKKKFKHLFTMFCILNIFFTFIDLIFIFEYNVPVDFGIFLDNIFKTIVYGIVCIAYIKMSTRVKHTFVS